MKRCLIFCLAVACLLALTNAACNDNPLRMTLEYTASVPERDRETGRFHKVDLTQEHFLEQPVTQNWNGICPSLNYQDTCCDEAAYNYMGEKLAGMKAYMDQVRDDMTLVVERGVFALNFLWWLVKEVVGFILDFVGEYISQSVGVTLQNGFRVVVDLLDHCVNILTIILDFTPQLLDYDQCNDYDKTCDQITPEYRAKAIAECEESGKKCDALVADLDRRAKICAKKNTLNKIPDCGSINRCWDAIYNTAIGHACLACAPKWSSDETNPRFEGAITCSGKDCTINLDEPTAAKLVHHCQDFALMFFPNMIARVFGYVVSDWLKCPVQNTNRVTGDEVANCIEQQSVSGVARTFLTAVKWMMDRFDELTKAVDKVVAYDVLNFKDIFIAKYLFGRSQGFDIGVAFQDHFADFSDFGMFFLPSILLDVNEWLWEHLFEWTKDVFGSEGVVKTIFDALMSFLVERFHKANPSIKVPYGAPGYAKINGTAEEHMNVYTATFTRAMDSRMNHDTWARSRGGVAPYLPTQSVFRQLEQRGVIRPEDFRRPNGVSLDRLRQIGFEEEVAEAVRIAKAEEEARRKSEEAVRGLSYTIHNDDGTSEVVTTQLRDPQFKITVTNENDYTLKTNFVAGGYSAWKYGACTGIIAQFKKDCDVKTDTFKKPWEKLDELFQGAKDQVAKVLNVSNDMAGYLILGVIGLLVLIMIACCCRKPKYPQIQGNYSGYSYY